jgi:acetate kinase
MSDVILVLNAGSSSLKFTLFDVGGEEPSVLCSGQISGIGTSPRFEAGCFTATETARWDKDTWDGETGPSREELLRFLLDWVQDRLSGHRLIAAGHRVVHGGDRFAGPVRIDAAVLDELERLEPLAPLHQPHNLFPIRVLAELHPGLPQVACFDTAFHRSQPEEARRFALPRDLHDQGIKRYGFHGLSYEYIARELRRVAPEIARGRVVVAHLGNGASLCALDGGRSVDSTMGYTAIDGLIMGTRCGALDAGVVLDLIARRGMSVAEVEKMLYSRSGLLGMSGISNDMRDLLASDRPEAAEAISVFVRRIAKELGGLTAMLGGIDALVFTAGIGERSAAVRDLVCRRAAWLGIELDPIANRAAAKGPRRLSPDYAPVSIWVVPTDEERMIALHTQTVLGAVPGASDTSKKEMIDA